MPRISRGYAQQKSPFSDKAFCSVVVMHNKNRLFPTRLFVSFWPQKVRGID